MGTPAASDLPLAPGAGHGGEGDASLQGPAQEEVLSVLPKSANEISTNEVSTKLETATNTDDGTVIPLVARIAKPETEETKHETSGLVMTRPKPEKRLNAQQRAKAKREKDKPEAAVEAAVTPEVSGLITAHPKPEKRKNAKERAKEKFAKKGIETESKAETKDGTTPMTATAKSKVSAKDSAKAKKGKPRAAKAA